MDYFTLQGSCLISILIPINFAVGDYNKFLKEIGIKKIYMDIAILLFGTMVTIMLIIVKIHPYISFILIGGIVVAVIQNSIIFRNIKVRADRYNDIEKVLKILEILIGGVLIILPHINILSRYFLVQSNTIICVLCYSIYAFWGVEKILFSSFNLYFNKKKSKKMK